MQNLFGGTRKNHGTLQSPDRDSNQRYGIFINPNPNPKPLREINDSAGTMKGKIKLRDIIYHSRKNTLNKELRIPRKAATHNRAEWELCRDSRWGKKCSVLW